MTKGNSFLQPLSSTKLTDQATTLPDLCQQASTCIDTVLAQTLTNEVDISGQPSKLHGSNSLPSSYVNTVLPQTLNRKDRRLLGVSLSAGIDVYGLRGIVRATGQDEKMLAGNGRIQWVGGMDPACIPHPFTTCSTHYKGLRLYDRACERVVYAQELCVISPFPMLGRSRSYGSHSVTAHVSHYRRQRLLAMRPEHVGPLFLFSPGEIMHAC